MTRDGPANLILPGSAQGRAAKVRIKRPSERRSLSRSATRALDVLELFGAERRPLRAIEISRSLAMQPSTTDQLLKTMVDSAHLVFDARQKTYLPSPRLIGFSSWIVDSFGADERLRELVRDVQARTGMVVTLTTPNDLFMQIIDLAGPEGSQTERGLRISLFGSAIGSAYLATLAPDALEHLAERARVAVGELPGIAAAVAAIRQARFSDGPSAEGVMWSIAMALPMQGHPIPLVLGLAGPPELVQRDRDRLQRIMREAMERRIGASPAAG